MAHAPKSSFLLLTVPVANQRRPSCCRRTILDHQIRRPCGVCIFQEELTAWRVELSDGVEPIVIVVSLKRGRSKRPIDETKVCRACGIGILEIKLAVDRIEQSDRVHSI